MGEKIEALSCDTSEGACQRRKEMAMRRIRKVKEVKGIGKHCTTLAFSSLFTVYAKDYSIIQIL